MEKVDYAEFALPNGEKNLFMFNNAFREDYLKMIYMKCSRILKEYEDSKAFNVDYSPYFFLTTDKDRRILNPSKSASQMELNKSALEQVQKLLNSKNEYDKEYLCQIAQSYKVICDGVAEIGFNGIVEAGYKTKAIEDAIAQSKLNKQLLSTGVKREVYKVFKENTRYTVAEINSKLMRIYEKFGIKYKKTGCSGRIELYFKIKKDNKEDNRGWMLISRRYSS